MDDIIDHITNNIWIIDNGFNSKVVFCEARSNVPTKAESDDPPIAPAITLAKI
jgi:hypothetical protein